MIEHRSKSKISESLYGIFDIVRDAYPDGMPEENYFPLIQILGKKLPEGPLTELISFLFQREFHVVANDVLKVHASPRAPYSVKPELQQVERVRDKLLSWGLYDWEITPY